MRLLGPLLYNIFLFDLFIIIGKTYFPSNADDNKLYVITKVLQELETVWKKFFMWFTDIEMMANTDKRHLFLSSVEDLTIEIDRSTVNNSRCKSGAIWWSTKIYFLPSEVM